MRNFTSPEESVGFKSCPHEPCLYVKHSGDSITLIALYVDDLWLLDTMTLSYKLIRLSSSNASQWRTLVRLTSFWGYELLVIVQSVLCIFQKPSTLIKYLTAVARVIRSPVLLLCKSNPPSFPLGELTIRLLNHYTAKLLALRSCWWYVLVPIDYAAGTLSNHCESIDFALECNQGFFRFIKCTRTTGIAFGSQKSVYPVGYCDSAWASCRVTRKSI